MNRKSPEEEPKCKTGGGESRGRGEEAVEEVEEGEEETRTRNGQKKAGSRRVTAG